MSFSLCFLLLYGVILCTIQAVEKGKIEGHLVKEYD